MTTDIAANETIRISNGPSPERQRSAAKSLGVCDYELASVYEG